MLTAGGHMRCSPAVGAITHGERPQCFRAKCEERDRVPPSLSDPVSAASGAGI